MSTLMNADTRLALGDDAWKCESRSLLLEKLPFFDDCVSDSKRVALDSLLPRGLSDLRSLREAHRIEVAKQERRRDEGDSFNQGKLDESQAFLASTQALSQRAGPAPEASVEPLRWIGALPATRRRAFTLSTADRLAVGLANGVLENCGLTLHRFFGQPMIPGSALKGIAVDAARELPNVAAEIDLLFATVAPGQTPRRQGAIMFLSAFPAKPDAPLEFDIGTPHYPKYYTGTGNSMAEDTENPIPNVFPTVAKDVAFQFTLVCPSLRLSETEAIRLLTLAEQSLRHGLTTRGIGAKTASGYGWFKDPDRPSARSTPTIAFKCSTPAKNPVLEKWRGQGHHKGNLRVMLPELAAIQDTAALEAALPNIVGEHVWKAFRKNNPYWQSFASNPDGRQILDRLSRKLS